MKTQLIILRGNSGSGKTTLAHDLNTTLPGVKLLISQDVVRREMLFVKDEPDNLAIDLIYEMACYGKNRVDYVILEGILVNKIYGHMLKSLIQFFQGNVTVCYFDLTLEETMGRHKTKKTSLEFGEAELRRWFKKGDFLGTPNELTFTNEMTREMMLKIIEAQIK